MGVRKAEVKRLTGKFVSLQAKAMSKIWHRVTNVETDSAGKHAKGGRRGGNTSETKQE